MAQFKGTLRIEGQRGTPLPVKAEVADDHLILTSEGSDLGTWPLAGLEPQARGAGVGLVLDGDPVVIDVGNADVFYKAVAGQPVKRAKGRQPRRRDKPPQRTPEDKAPKAERPRPSPRVVAAIVVLLAAVVAAILAPTAVGAVALFVGLVLVVVASGAVVDSRVALRIPFGLQAMHLMVAGVVFLVIGVLLTFLG